MGIDDELPSLHDVLSSHPGRYMNSSTQMPEGREFYIQVVGGAGVANKEIQDVREAALLSSDMDYLRILDEVEIILLDSENNILGK